MLGRITLPFLVVLLAAATASSAQAGSLTVELVVVGRQPQSVTCPAGSPVGTPDNPPSCIGLSGHGSARGLGPYTANATIVLLRRPTGGFESTVTGSVTTTHGSFVISGDNSSDPTGYLKYAITLSGAGGFAGATGTGTLNFVGGEFGTGEFIIDMTVDAPGVTFDLTPPTLTVRKTTARSLGSGRYAVTIRYLATDAGDPLTAKVTRSGTAKPIASGPATGIAKATVRLKAGTRLVLRLTITDASDNSTTRAVIVPLH